MIRGLNFETKVRSMVNITRMLMGCDFLYSDFSDRVVDTPEDYKINTGNAVAGHMVRLWNNSCFIDPEQDFELKLSNIAYIVKSDELDFATIVIKKEDVVYNAIPSSCVSLSGKYLSVAYEGNDSPSFLRLIGILYSMCIKLFATDPSTYLGGSEHIMLRRFKAQVILALCLKYSIADSPKFKKYSVKDIINKILALGYASDDALKPLADIFAWSMGDIFQMSDSMSFVEIIHELYDDNVLARYYREMANKLYEIDHPNTASTETKVTEVSTTSNPKAISTSEENVPFEKKLNGAFDILKAKAKETKLKDKKVHVTVDDSGEPNLRMFN